jgi:vacuolar-type H+-ATPase subunit E/Vma4
MISNAEKIIRSALRIEAERDLAERRAKAVEYWLKHPNEGLEKIATKYDIALSTLSRSITKKLTQPR